MIQDDEEKRLLGATDAEFRQSLEDSKPAVRAMARWLARHVHSVRVPGTKCRPGYKQRKYYSDRGDLYFVTRPGEPERRGEVKHLRKLMFTRIEHLYPKIIVNAVQSWDKANPKPFIHFLVNPPMTHFIYLLSSTFEFWTKEKRFDSRKKGPRWFYLCPRQHFEIRLMEERWAK